MWTAECAEAYSLAKPVMALGDEVGARMAFKEAYVRLVAAARAERRPAAWTASIGWDGGLQDQALERAVVTSLLPMPTVRPLFSGPVGDEPLSDKAREQLAAIKKMVADGLGAHEARLEAEHEQRVAADDAERAEINRKVEEYARRTGIPMAAIRPVASG